MKIPPILCAQVTGPHVDMISVEVDLSRGLHAFTIIGLADKAIGEAKDRVSSAIKNSGFVSPKQKNQKVVISLAPGGIRKDGTSFDLAIAVAYLASALEITFTHDTKSVYIGELSLDGQVRPVRGVLPMVLEARKNGVRNVFIPEDNANEVTLLRDILIYPVASLGEIVQHLNNGGVIKPIRSRNNPLRRHDDIVDVDFSMIIGQEKAKRAMIVAALGRHNVMLCGPPGTGKTMLARAFASIMPNLSYDECIEVTAIHSAYGILRDGIINRPPIRSPHHTSTKVAIIGGGDSSYGGEITLANRGVLLLDEFSEFSRDTIEALRQPMEDRVVTVSRSRDKYTLPADTILIMTMNPCPCGMFGHFRCSCSERDISRYHRKVSGPISDRIDIWMTMSQEDVEKGTTGRGGTTNTGETSKEIRDRIRRARYFQQNHERQAGVVDEVEIYSKLMASGKRLSMRGYSRLIRVARTIADLENSLEIKKGHIDEALGYRPIIKLD